VSWYGYFFVYVVVWWVVLFTVLPWGVKSYHEAGVVPPKGCDPAAPMNPNLMKKFITTSWLSAIVFAIGWTVVHFGLVPLPNIPGGL
jgi:predicted secreted protein